MSFARSVPAFRPRRLRRTPALRRLVAQTRLHPADLVLPMFVKESLTEPVPLTSMPGVLQHTRESLKAAATQAVSAGVGGLMIFGIPEVRDGIGSRATDPGGILNVALADLGAQATSGADLVGTSGMMDGQVGAVRTALD